MTNEKKIEILKGMRELIVNQTCDYLCSAYCEVTGKIRSNQTESELQYLGLQKPDKTYDTVRWFPGCDRQSRLDLIDNAITKFESEPMNKEKIQSEIKQCREKLERLEKELAESNDKIDLSKEYEDAGMYWVNASTGIAEDPCSWGYFKGRYPSRLTAEKEALRIKLIQIAYILNGGDFVPKNKEVCHFFYINRDNNEVAISSSVYTCYGEVIFKTRELAEKAMKQFSNEELIKMLS